MKRLLELFTAIIQYFGFKQKPKKSFFPPVVKPIHSYGSYKNIIWVRFSDTGKTEHYVVLDTHKVDDSTLYILIRFISGYPDGFTQIINNVKYVVKIDGE